MIHLSDNCWQDLADAVVLAAVEDWRRSNIQLRSPSLTSRYAVERVRECEKFFRSSWFEILTGLDGRVFIKRLTDGYGFSARWEEI